MPIRAGSSACASIAARIADRARPRRPPRCAPDAGEPAIAPCADRRSPPPPTDPGAPPRSCRASTLRRRDSREARRASPTAIVLAWGWRRARDRVRRRARCRRWRWRRSTPGRCCSSPFRCWSGSIDGAGGRRAGRRCRARRSPAGGSASAISSPASTGSATPSWSTPRPSAGCCRSRSSALPAGLALLHRARLRARARCSGRAGRRASSRSRSRSPPPNGCAAICSPAFPWNAFGYALTGPLVLAQSASLIGIWGLTFIAVAVFASPAVLADERADTPRPLAAARARRRRCSPRSPATARCGLPRTPTALRRRRAAAHHAAEPAAGREVQLRRQAAGDEPLSRAVRPRDRAAIERRARRHASDLAGIGVSVLPDARAGRAGADRRRCCRRARC